MEDTQIRTSTDWRHVVLFILAFITATVAGAGFGTEPMDPYSDPTAWLHGLWYSVPVIAILFAHEMGHFLTARKYGVASTPPFFIPGLPIPGVGVLPFIGTFGAFIRMHMHRITPNQLLSIGAWGPVAGFIVTLPVLFIGFALSEVRPLPPDMVGTITLGDSLILWIGEMIFHPNIPEGHDVYLHPMAMAGWVGCFLTALNLMPVGQLDGGHILYSTFGERFNTFAPMVFASMIVFGIVFFPGWLVIAGLVYFMGIKHPPVMTSGVAEKPWLTYVCVVIFILTFAPAPIEGASLLSLFEG